MVRTLTALGSLLVMAGGASAACFSYEDDPALCYECRGETSGAADGGGDVVTPSGCIPSENPGTSVGDACGVFVSVSAGSDGNAGTKDAPVATLAKAVALAGAGEKRVYLCAEQLEGAAKVPAGFTIFGGLDCAAGWVYVGDQTPTKLLGPADQIALVLEKGGGTTRLEDVHVIARDATKAGGSSIAALADGVTAELVRCTLEAGDGADGTSGEAYAEAAAAGVDGNPGSEACSAGAVLGGNETPHLCGDVSSLGGNGGQGNANSGGDGSDGAPGMAINGGTGEKIGSPCADGITGDAGPVGMPGPGGSGLGVLDKTGYKGVAGMEGAPGTPGQGGGGGGGSRGGSGLGKCTDMTMAGGASGGSGASGGCGGAGGKPGGAGGSSIALISLDAKLSFSSSKLTAKKGGNGGSGGVGQAGGAGGVNGGAGGSVPVVAGSLKPGCAGGPGGAGGSGGPGGNGAGGHSLGIAHTGAAPAMDGAMITPGQPGTGGATADPEEQPGQAGTAEQILAFP